MTHNFPLMAKEFLNIEKTPLDDVYEIRHLIFNFLFTAIHSAWQIKIARCEVWVLILHLFRFDFLLKIRPFVS